MRPVVQHVAALAKALQVAWMVVGRVVVEMGSREYDSGGAELVQHAGGGESAAPPAPVAPAPDVDIEPAAVGQAGHDSAMWPAVIGAP